MTLITSETSVHKWPESSSGLLQTLLQIRLGVLQSRNLILEYLELSLELFNIIVLILLFIAPSRTTITGAVAVTTATIGAITITTTATTTIAIITGLSGLHG